MSINTHVDRTKRPLVIAKATYDTTGSSVPFVDPDNGSAAVVVAVTVSVISGTAGVSYTGSSSAAFLALPEKSVFTFPCVTGAVWIKGIGASADVSIVGHLDA